MFTSLPTPDLRLESAVLHRESFVWALHCCRGDAGRAEDALQEAYLKILDGRARFGGRSSFKTWLLTLIRHTAADEWRRSERHTARLAAWEADPREPVVSPDAALAAGQAQAGVRAALTSLPARQREVLTLVFYQGYFICQRHSGGKFACCERLKVPAICSVPKRWPWAAVSALRGRLERGRCFERFDWSSDRRSGLVVVGWRA